MYAPVIPQGCSAYPRVRARAQPRSRAIRVRSTWSSRNETDRRQQMQPALAFALLLMSTSACFAQDAELRDRAVALLERAHAASIPPNLPNLERVDTFSVFNPDAQAREGSFSRVVIQGTGRREEITFGNYHVTHVWTGNTLATSEGNTTLIPPQVVTVMRLTPILLLRFDDSDVIRAIGDRQIARRSLHCIEFDTIRGSQTQNNEICVDAANGTVAS